ncbi:MAG: lysylphosphatidylglycerol synthase domain-containing protein [Woeseia sp.]
MQKKTLTFLKRAALLTFVALMILLIISKAREMDWAEVLQALRSYDVSGVAPAFAIAVPAYLACASFDLVGRFATGHSLSVGRTMLISWTGYFFSLNLGALIGGLAFRYRLYMPYKLSGMSITQVIALSVVTNWLGYLLIAGGVLVWEPPALPSGWGVTDFFMRGIGVLLLIAALSYIALCAFRGGTAVRWKGSELFLPTMSVAALQIALSLVSWASIGAVITWLLGGAVSWMAVMPVLMISAIAGIWSHIPSGLGVTEFVFVALLGHQVPDSRLLAAIIVFRIVYYLVPFALAVLGYAWLEATAGRIGAVKRR